MLILLGLFACKVTDAPEDVEDLVVYAFDHTDDSNRFRTASGDGLVPVIDEQFDAMLEGYAVHSLTADDIRGVGVELPEDEELDIVGAASTVDMVSELDPVADVLCDDNLEDVFSATIEYDVNEEIGDRDCFLSHECDGYDIVGTRVTDLGLLGEGTQDFESAFRWVALSDGRTGLFIRQLSPDDTVLGNDIVKIHSNYSFAFLYPKTDGGLRRMEAQWIDAEVVGADIPETFALDIAVRTMANRANELDVFLGAVVEE